ncbi:hypothetical protein BDF21DRAFT_496396 [Thamnidium elegans]|uniref:Metallo-beta-lactamase domain-containing protein n=1 Tax=Thamnidium elegans TaxID=101142 RepID=A0A8H7SKI7_9FUNG|nr:hypothetical protein INT48_006428 [Thamnidium elegans]KAI8066048.1 hypothetical protein BDF21DRAFT_496396 [Thamnidium elegans]
MTEALVFIPSFSQLSSRVWRVLGLNPGKFCLQGTNTYLLGAGSQKILLDCGEGVPEYLNHLETSLTQTDQSAYISDIIISHGHRDHWGGLVDILNSPILNPNKTIKVHKFPIPTGFTLDHLDSFPKDISVYDLIDKQVFKLQDTTLNVIYTPGHTKDHCTFWLEEEQSIFTADCVLGQGTAVFEDLSEYIDGLSNLLTFKPKHLYPGHGPFIENGMATIQQYIDHRMEREAQVIDLLVNGEKKSWSALEIVQILYKDYPESLHLPAARSIVLHLLKLKKDGKVTTPKTYEMIPENLFDIIHGQWHWISHHQNNL